MIQKNHIPLKEENTRGIRKKYHIYMIFNIYILESRFQHPPLQVPNSETGVFVLAMKGKRGQFLPVFSFFIFTVKQMLLP
jgi:hypothetical protein